MTLAAGTTLKDNIVLMREIGRGAMGTVFLARNRSLGSEVAVKVLRGAGADGQTAARFAQEARAIARIDSPHVVKIFDYGVTGEGEPFFVMELLRGTDLRGHIERSGPLPLDATATVLQQACSALARAHELGIVHRDVKPANIFLQDVGGGLFVKLLDFGVAKQLHGDDLGMTGTGMMMGTPYYMSPEQFTSPRDVDARSDLWSMAVVAYACVTGTLPFLGETAGAITVAVHRGEFTPASAARPGLPPGVDAWFARALRPRREERFQSARELAEAFDAAVKGAAAPAGAVQAYSPPVQTHAGAGPAQTHAAAAPAQTYATAAPAQTHAGAGPAQTHAGPPRSYSAPVHTHAGPAQTHAGPAQTHATPAHAFSGPTSAPLSGPMGSSHSHSASSPYSAMQAPPVAGGAAPAAWAPVVASPPAAKKSSPLVWALPLGAVLVLGAGAALLLGVGGSEGAADARPAGPAAPRPTAVQLPASAPSIEDPRPAAPGPRPSTGQPPSTPAKVPAASPVLAPVVPVTGASASTGATASPPATTASSGADKPPLRKRGITCNKSSTACFQCCPKGDILGPFPACECFLQP